MSSLLPISITVLFSPQSTQQWGKRPLHIKGRSLLINTSPWNPTLPKEAHGDVFIRSDLPLMCRGLFPHCYVLLGKNKSVRDMGPKVDNIYTTGAGSLHIIFHSGKILYFVVERCYIIALLFRSIYNFFLLLIFCIILKEVKTIYFC